MLRSPAVHDPRSEILARLEARRSTVAALDRADARFAMVRLAVFAAAAAVAVASLWLGRLSAWWLAAPAAAFAAIALRHDAALRRRERARRAVAFHEAALARVEERWRGLGNRGDRFAVEDHPYAQDLDLFGEGSLFELLCTARTRPGEETLAAWLLGPAVPEELRARQRAVAELAPRLDLREDLAVLGEDVRAEVDPASLAAWAEGPPILPGGGALAPAAALASALTLAALAGWAAGVLHPLAFAGGVVGLWGLSRTLRDAVDRVLGGVARPGRELDVLAKVLERLEREPFEEPRLAGLRRALAGDRGSASRAIAGLARRTQAAEWAHNQLFAPIGFLLAWRVQWAIAIERWRLAHGADVRRWLAALGEAEALSSIAAYAREHPADPFPELAGGPARLEGEGLRHPLLPVERCVPNDVRLGPDARLLVVSGSNMSGKSTLLRTVGVNAVLALAGAPVRARRLALTRLALGATLRIQDSLQGGRSRFYAEIERLKQLADLAHGEVPLLFLLDEVLHGTNSHDRLVGAEAVLRQLLARGAVGLVTTHDLALTDAAARLPQAGNAHFEDRIEDGQIAFDYRLRPGVVTRSNALALMRAVGLEV
jgi:hypothetical protein